MSRRTIWVGVVSFGFLLSLLLIAPAASMSRAAFGAPASDPEAVYVTATLPPTATPIPLTNDRLLHDTSLLTVSPDCLPPCWHGIKPGITSWDSALKQLDADATLGDLTINGDDASDAEMAGFAPEGGENCCQLYTVDRHLVSLIFLRLAPKIKLARLIEVQGEPTYLIGSSYSSDEMVVNLMYPGQSLVVYVVVNGMTEELNEDSKIVGALYMTPADMDLLINTSSLYRWDGYQSYWDYVMTGYAITPAMTLTPTPP